MTTIAEKYEAERTGMILGVQVSPTPVELKVNVFRGGTMPEIQTVGSACFDIHADLSNGFVGLMNIYEGKTHLIPTGLKFHIPQGYKLEVYSRSGLSAKHGIIVLNAPAQIDSDYTGELFVPLHNTLKTAREQFCEKYTIKHGDRIAQAALVPVVNTQLVQTDEEPQETERGSGSFGSTGV
jgi:dUTP pyrophosphatase